MYSFKLTFYPRNGDVNDYYSSAVSTYLAALCGNGQILSDWNTACVDDHFETTFIAPEETSLSFDYYNVYVAEAYEKLLARSQREPHSELIGSQADLEQACQCESSSSYILCAGYIHPEPPVICGDCGKHVPLYRLPYYKDEKEYRTLLSWECRYKACDGLYMHSGVGERFGWRQISYVNSKLTLEGLDICREMSDKIHKPFYYYLISKIDHCPEKCPSCGFDWLLKRTMPSGFRAKCDNCKLVSIMTWR